VIGRATKTWAVHTALCALALLIALSLLLASGAARSASGQEADEGEGREAGERSSEGEVAKEWRLKYQETFGKPLPGEEESEDEEGEDEEGEDEADGEEQAPWVREDRSQRPPYSLYGMKYDGGDQWRVKYGNDYFESALASFDTYRKSFQFGKDGWLTAELSARDARGAAGDSYDDPGDRPSISSEALPGAGRVAKLDVPSHTGGALIRSTEPLPQEYRIEYDLKTIDFGGERNGTLEYDGKLNGYDKEGCKTLHPWNATGGTDPAAHCDWPSVREGVPGTRQPGAYNQFHFLSIMDVMPVPQNNGWPHFHRKIMMDAFNPHPDRKTGGKVCNSDTGEYYDYDTQSTRNAVNMLWLGPQTGATRKGANNRQMFVSSCEEGSIAGTQISAAEMQPELMPKEDYTFAIERSKTGYVMEVSGNFRFVGEETYRFYRDFVDENTLQGRKEENVPIWHYNVTPEEYDGRFNSYVEEKGPYGVARVDNIWPAGSAYPDYFFIGDGYTNVAEGNARVDDVRLYVPKENDG